MKEREERFYPVNPVHPVQNVFFGCGVLRCAFGTSRLALMSFFSHAPKVKSNSRKRTQRTQKKNKIHEPASGKTLTVKVN